MSVGQLACCQPEMLTRPQPREPCVCWVVGQCWLMLVDQPDLLYVYVVTGILVFPTDICSAGVWPLLSNLEDPELRRLAAGLPAIVLSSRADGTTRKYLGAFQ